MLSSSQPSMLSYPPPAAYPTTELVHSSFQYTAPDTTPVNAQPQWHGLPVESLPTARIPALTGHMPSPAIAPKPVTTPRGHMEMTHQMGKGEVSATPMTLPPAGDPGAQYPSHTVSATVTNSPFSVDYLLHKPTASDTGSGQLGYAQQSLALHSTEQYNQAGYSHLESYHQASVPSQQMLPPPVPYSPHDSTPGLAVHGVLQGAQVVSVQEQLPPTQHHDKHMASYSQTETEEHYADKLQPFQLYSVKPTGQENSTEDGDKLALNLPPPENPYSPPQLVPAEEESGHEGLGSCSNVDTYEHHESNSPPPPPPRSTSINQCQEAVHTSSSDVGEEKFAQPFTAGGFQLAVSPLPNNAHPMIGSVSSRSSTSSGQESLHRPTHIPTPPPLVPIGPTVRQRKGSASEDDDDVFFPPPFGRKVDQEQQEDFVEEEGKEEEEENECRPPALRVSSFSEPLARSSSGGNSITTGSVENSTPADKSMHDLPPPPPPPPPLVIGRRGRGAGKVLDEDKLRLPISRG